eukprot:2724968-Pyramimonas_sp.AAC.1
MNTSVEPSADFFTYANGGWVSTNPIPPEYSAWGSFHQLADRNLSTLKEMMEEATASQEGDPLKKKIGDFWSCGNDVDAVNALGMSPIHDLLARIDALDVKDAAFTELVSALHTEGVS